MKTIYVEKSWRGERILKCVEAGIELLSGMDLQL
jgi:hypothetical protein